MKKILRMLAIMILIPAQAFARPWVRSHVYVDGEVLTAENLNTSINEGVNAVNDITGNNLDSAISITSTGSINFSGNATLTGNILTLGNGSSSFMYINTPSGIEYSGASTWTFNAEQTVAGTWANLGTVNNVEVTGGMLFNTEQSSGIITSTSINSSPIGAMIPSTGAFASLNVGTTEQGDLLYDNGTSLVRLPPGVVGQYLATQGPSSNPTWAIVPHGSQVFLISGTFTAPAGVSIVYLTIVGGGGGGGGCSAFGTSSGGGGGGAAIINYIYSVTGGNNYGITVGAGGGGGTTGGGNGSIGGVSYFDTSGGNLSVTGGNGGVGSNSGSTNGGSGGASTINASASVSTAGLTGGGYIAFPGGNGAKGNGAGGGGGGGSMIGIGATGISSSVTGPSASANTGGGGAGSYANGNGGTGYAGGTGGSGIVIVTW